MRRAATSRRPTRALIPPGTSSVVIASRTTAIASSTLIRGPYGFGTSRCPFRTCRFAMSCVKAVVGVYR